MAPAHAAARARARWYAETVVEEDLRYHLDVLDEADDEYRAALPRPRERVPRRGRAGGRGRLPAIQRLKWHLVRRRLLPELLEVVALPQGAPGRRAEAADRRCGRTATTRSSTTRGLDIPRSVYRLDTARRRVRHLRVLLG